MQLYERSRKFIGPSPTNASSDGISAKPADVTTALTPGNASALSVLIDTMRACACGLRFTLPHSMPGIVMSAPKAARPITLSTPSGRIGLVPTTLREALSRYVMSYSMTEKRFAVPAEAGSHSSTAPSPDRWAPAFAGAAIRLVSLRRLPPWLLGVERGAQLRRRHRQVAQADAGRVEDRVGDRRHRRYERHLADT